MIEKRNEEGGVYLTLKNDCGLSLTLSEMGGGIYEIVYDGEKMNIAPSGHKAYEVSAAYFGKTVGRISGRIKDAVLPYEGQCYEIDQNEGYNTLHGGARGLSYVRFTLQEAREENDALIAIFAYSSPKGEMGFPEKADIKVIYTLSRLSASFSIDYEMRSEAKTPLGLTNHTYFNLGGEKDVSRCLLQVKADRIFAMDEEMVPTEPIPLSPLFDFNTPKEIGPVADDPSLRGTKANGLDHIYRLLKGEGPSIRLENAEYALEIKTDFPCCCFYADNYPRDGMILNTGFAEKRQSGLAIEPCETPHDYEAMSVFPKNIRRRKIEYRFSKKEGKGK